MQCSIVTNEEANHTVISAFVPGRGLLNATNTHPNFRAIKEQTLAVLGGESVDEEAFADLFDPAVTVATRFKSLSDRLAVANGRVYFDGDEVHGVLVDHILRAIREDAGLAPLVAFYENVAQNPDDHSRENLYRWLNTHDFTIDNRGFIIGYKGVRSDLTSVNAGPAIVNEEPVNGHVPNQPGSVISIARSRVNHDPAVGCSTGLHVGTYDCAKTFGSVILEVRVNPRDVVSVPTDCNDRKMRVCRYEVVDVIKNPYTEAIHSDKEDEVDWEAEASWWASEDEAYERYADQCPNCGYYELDEDGFCYHCGEYI